MISRETGITDNAFSALEAILIADSFILIAYTVDGNLSVNPRPTIEVVAIPIADVVPDPELV